MQRQSGVHVQPEYLFTFSRIRTPRIAVAYVLPNEET